MSSKARNKLAPHYTALFALALAIIGFGSTAFHAYLTFNTQFADVFGMYLIATFIFLYGLQRHLAMPSIVTVIAYLSLNAGLAFLLLIDPEARRYAFALVLISGLVLELGYRTRYAVHENAKFLWLAVGAMAAGFAVWIADITKTFCRPDSLLQGHAVWHVLGAIASGCLYLYYTSKRNSEFVA